MIKRLVVLFLFAGVALAEYPYPESEPCPQDGNTAFAQGMCAHGSDAVVCTYSHLTGQVDSSGRPERHVFTVAFRNR
jgi:hypothetical protein